VWVAGPNGGTRYEAAGSTSTGSKGVDLTANGSTNTENSSYTQVISSTAFNAQGFYLQLRPPCTGTVTQYLVDVALGASSNERDIITDLHVHRSADTDGSAHGFYAYFPIPIAAGSRISARVRSNVASAVMEIIVSLCAGAHFPTFSRVTCYGQDTSDSGGLLIDPGGTINTMVWTQFSSSLTNPMRLMYLSLGYRANSTASIGSFLIRVARGASGAEANNVMFADWLTKVNAGSDAVLPACMGPVPVSFNAGERLAVGVQCSSSDSQDRLIDCQVIGVD